MKIRHVSIRNFRGIETLDWAVPESNVICLIGRGDSTKSSILDAIRYALFPVWNLTLDAFDFFNGDTENAIEITLTLGDLPKEFLTDAKFGHFLRGWDKESATLSDEPGEGLEEVISARLHVDAGFQPKWTVICERKEEGARFTAGDRAKAFATFIGAYADRQLTWGKNTVLSRITDSENITASLAEATQAAKHALNEKRTTDLASFDSAAKIAETIARSYGVPVSADGSYRAHLDTTAVNIQAGGLSLHDGDIPLRTLGLGSRRMLTFGIEQQGLKEPHITLVDEIEYGLEPHRIARLLKNLASDGGGQYVITTHSPVVLRELSVDQLFVAQSSRHETTVICTAIPELSDVVQGKIREGAEAFLARNVIVCEGSTEMGLTRGLDTHWIAQGYDPFSFTGTAAFNAHGGANVRSSAEAFHNLGYRVAAIVDSDAEEHFSSADEQALLDIGVCTVWWDGAVSLEEYFFLKLPWDKVITSVRLAMVLHGDGVIDQIRSQFGNVDYNIETWIDSAALRQAIGKASLGNSKGQNAWFKRQDQAEQWTDQIADAFDLTGADLAEKINPLKLWVSGV